MTKPALCTMDGQFVTDLAAESNHRIANNLAILASMIQMQRAAVSRGPASLSSSEVRFLLNEIAGKIVGVGHLHRTLAQRPHHRNIDLGNCLEESCHCLLSSLNLGERTIIVHELDGGCEVTPEQAQPVVLIVNEVLMNAIKYAHPTGVPVRIRLACWRVNGGQLAVEVADDGIGLPEGFNAMTDGGVGFTLIRSLASSLGARLAVDSDALGTTFRIVFGVARPRSEIGAEEEFPPLRPLPISIERAEFPPS
ncbi:MAG TPA: sensor histidine kinase [Rhizomicrobium sp.]|jgi:two-component sensor histidine kinase